MYPADTTADEPRLSTEKSNRRASDGC